MYPDAEFVGIVRDPRAVCEGHIRRQLYSVKEIAEHSSSALQQMISDEKAFSNLKLWKYEDIVLDPQKALREIYNHCDLDIKKVDEIRMETKSVVGQDNAPKEKTLVWYKLDEFHKHILPNANENQIAKLSEEDRKKIEDICRDEMEHFGYI